MSKKAAAEKESPKIMSIDAAIRKKYGDILFAADTIREIEGQVIPTTLNMDIALNGGIVEGTIVSIAGVPGSGKTTLCLEIIKNAQKMDKPCFYMDVEGRLRTDLLTTIEGLDLSKLKIIRSSKEKLMWAEDSLNLLEQIIREVPGCVIVLDSVAALCSTAASDTALGESKRMMAIPSMLYDNLRKASQILPVMRSNVIMITHIQANPSAYGGPVEVGGNALKYFGSIRMVCHGSQEFPKDGAKEGRESTFKILKSALGPPSTATVYIRYGKGCDKYLDLCKAAEEMGILNRAGAWYTMPNLKGYEEEKWQGIDNVMETLKESPEMFETLDTTVRDLIFGKKE